jgi:ElaB/YqjD/DUF883 family membrane-anchored ribosome-binding protein
VDDELEVIRHQMEEKRASLADKLDLLENQVMETVQEATASVNKVVDTVTSTVGTVTENVQDTVKSVKDTLTEGVHETVETVKETLDIRQQVRNHPWGAFAGSVALGVVGGYLLGGSRAGGGQRRAGTWGPSPSPPETSYTPSPTPSPARSFVPEEPAGRQEPSPLQEAAATAMSSLRGLAIGALMGVIREVAANNLPAALKDEVAGMLNQMNTKLGGKDLGDLGIMEAFRALQEGNGHAAERPASNGPGFRPEASRGNGV